MTITIQLSPQIEDVLVTRARENGMSVDAYVQSVLEGAAAGRKMLALSPEDFEAALDELSSDSERLPVLPPEAYNREGIYGGG